MIVRRSLEKCINFYFSISILRFYLKGVRNISSMIFLLAFVKISFVEFFYIPESIDYHAFNETVYANHFLKIN